MTAAPSLHALHRLDVPTHGLLVLGKTLRFTSHFNALLRERQVRKQYKVFFFLVMPHGGTNFELMLFHRTSAA
jgi:23S rRNA-/tRNA-specific pseudouridylate synthase